MCPDWKKKKKIGSITKNKGEKNIRVTLEAAIAELKIALKKNKQGTGLGEEGNMVLFYM